MGQPHKHAELIKAWADGADIEFFDLEYGQWIDEKPPFVWDEGSEYRIKPAEKKPVVRWKWALINGLFWQETYQFLNEEEAKEVIEDGGFRLEYTRTEFPK